MLVTKYSLQINQRELSSFFGVKTLIKTSTYVRHWKYKGKLSPQSFRKLRKHKIVPEASRFFFKKILI